MSLIFEKNLLNMYFLSLLNGILTSVAYAPHYGSQLAKQHTPKSEIIIPPHSGSLSKMDTVGLFYAFYMQAQKAFVSLPRT